MEQKTIIYTYGDIFIEATKLIHLLQPYHINCVVDCRPLTNTRNPYNTPSDELKEILKQEHITYIPFSRHFGLFNSDIRNKQGNPVYRKVIQNDKFLQGIERINNGIEKGYRICIIDEQEETHKSKRFTIIGRYLNSTYQILHIHKNGKCYSQEQVEQKNLEIKELRKQKNKTSLTIGQTGEELAALYLSRSGYQILDRNWNLHKGCELDIVALKDNKLHFIEVKTRTSDKYGEPETAINYRKMRNISKAIHTYLFRRGFLNIESQIDSIAIIYRSDQDYNLKHFLGLRFGNQPCDETITFSPTPSSP